MAPNTKKSRHSGKGRDQTRRKRTLPIDNEQLYRTIGKFCGEECEAMELNMVTDSMECDPPRGRGSSRRSNGDVEMNDAVSNDANFEPKARATGAVKSGRVTKNRAKKSVETEMSLQMGMEKARNFIAEALEFGVWTGYLTPKDSKGKILQVAAELLQTRPRGRKVHQCEHPHHHLTDDAQDKAGKSRKSGRSRKKSASRKSKRASKGSKASKDGRKKRSRSRSRSHGKKHGSKGRRMADGESAVPASARSENSEVERNQQGEHQEQECDELAPTHPGRERDAATPQSSGNEDLEDRKSVKSHKSHKSAAAEKKEDAKSASHDEDDENEEASDDEDDEKK